MAMVLCLLRGPRAVRSRLEQLDLVAGGDGDDRALGIRALAHDQPAALALAGAVHRVHADDLHVEDRLDRLLDLGLVRAGVDDERVLVLVDQPVGLLGDDRTEDHVTGVLHASTSSAAGVLVRRPVPISSSAASSNTTTSLSSTS
jgi:hypothetical protein